MEIGWISDHFYPEFLGGAELTDNTLIEEGERRGYSIERLKTFREGYDFHIVSNVHKRDLNERLFDSNFIYFCHDSKPVELFQQRLIDNSLASVFMSPKHLEWAKETFEITGEYFLQPAAFNDLNKFQFQEKEERTVAYIGLLANHKGIDNIFDYARNHPQYEISLFGRMEMPWTNVPENIEYEGVLEEEKKYDTLGKIESFIHLPNWIEAFGRNVIEGYLSGCKLITNEKVGCLSYGWNWEKRSSVLNNLEEAPPSFWNKIEDLII